jgi:hypothetical protein
MVTQLNLRAVARDFGYGWMQYYCCARIVADPGGADVVKLVGKLPKGAVVTLINSRVVTAINGAGGVVTAGDPVATMTQAAGSETLMADPTALMPLPSDTEFYATIGGGATAGVAYVTILFFKP